jgi:hypothetical protein
MTGLDGFFADFPESRHLINILRKWFDLITPARLRVMKSQVVFRRKKDFAWIWIPGRYLKGRGFAPLVLTPCFPKPDPSPRWKQIVEPYPGRYMHHFEVFSPVDFEEEVRAWLNEAWKLAGLLRSREPFGRIRGYTG